MTVEEILRNTGLTDEQIKALDAKVMAGFTQVVSTATQTLEEAERVNRGWREEIDTKINPALDRWGNEKADQDARNAAMAAALKSAAEAGFILPEILKTIPAVNPTAAAGARTADGRFVANANPVPGSPGFEQKLTQELGSAFSFLADTTWKYRTLYGAEMPDPPTTIIREAAAQRMSPADYAAKKYDFTGKEKAKREADQKAHDDAIRKEGFEEAQKKFAEQGGNNPMLRQGQPSAFSTIAKGVEKGERKDPLKMSREERRQNTRQVISREIAANESSSVQ